MIYDALPLLFRDGVSWPLRRFRWTPNRIGYPDRATCGYGDDTPAELPEPLSGSLRAVLCRSARLGCWHGPHTTQDRPHRTRGPPA